MCGIIGYVGPKNIDSILLVGLERLSYRGYDSSGIAILSDGELSHWKKTGKIRELEKMLQNLSIKGELGIGHTRWATHGEPNEANAHPQISPNQKIAVVHNGIIENYSSIKSQLITKGHIFQSDTDTEVIAHLIESYLTTSLLDAVKQAVKELKGSYAIAVIAEADPGKIIVCRQGSPLIIGLGKDENLVSSDINAILPHTKEMVYLEDGELAIVTQKSVEFQTLSGQIVPKKSTKIEWDALTQEKEGFETFMLKEISEQPAIIRNVISKMVEKDKDIKLKKIKLSQKELSSINRLIIQACGTSWHAGLLGKYLLEKYARLLTEVDISSEFRYRQMLTHGIDVVLAISQSGETADTLACLREAKSKFFKVLSIVNVKGSSIDRESDGVMYSYAGQEVGVASTKNYLAQLVVIYLFALYMGKIRKLISPTEITELIQEIKRIPEHIETLLGQTEKIQKIAEKYYQSKEFLFIGRGVNYPSALEGALKLKEISYIHATGYPAGELKHGPIALIDDKLPVVCICPKTSTYEKMLSNIQEVRSRKGKTIIIATEGDTEIAQFADDIIYIPEVSEDLTPILVAIPMQILAYSIAKKLGCDVDQPRNLAKSVTVE
jgi:glucosamine--fructose-6-phosphate aminotransferase (isomerizing)